jgi:hypothetical protein
MDYKKLYDEAFSKPKYNLHSIKEPRFLFVLRNLDLNKVNTILDIGSGRGTLYNYIKQFPVKLDAADLNQYGDFPIIKLDVTKEEDWQKIDGYHVITCLDVLEHIEKRKMDFVLKWISSRCLYSIITVANHPDDPGDPILHVTKEKMPYWVSKIDKYFFINKMESIADTWYNFVLTSRNIVIDEKS